MMLVLFVSACVLLPIRAEANAAKLNFRSSVLLLTAIAVVVVVEVPLVVRTTLFFFKVLLSLPLELRRSSVV